MTSLQQPELSALHLRDRNGCSHAGVQVSAVEVWLPYRMCEHYLKRIDPRQKAQIDKMLKMKQRPVHFCKCVGVAVIASVVIV